MENLNELETMLENMIDHGLIDDMDEDDAKEVLRIVRPKTAEEREKEGISFIVTLDECGREVCYLDGGRGIRLKISRIDKR